MKYELLRIHLYTCTRNPAPAPTRSRSRPYPRNYTTAQCLAAEEAFEEAADGSPMKAGAKPKTGQGKAKATTKPKPKPKAAPRKTVVSTVARGSKRTAAAAAAAEAEVGAVSKVDSATMTKRQRLAAESNTAIGVGDRIFVKAWGKGYEYTVESIALSGMAQLASADGGEDAQANITKCLRAS